MLILSSLRLDNSMIEAHAIESDFDVGCPREIVAAVHGKRLELSLCDARHARTIYVQRN